MTTDPTAVVGRRVGGWIIDVLLCTLAVIVPAALLTSAFTAPDPDTVERLEYVDGDLAIGLGDTVYVLESSDLVVIAVSLMVVATLILGLLPGIRGWSPGLLAAELRVVRTVGGRPGVGRGLLRMFAWIVDGLPGVPLVGYVTMRLTREHRRVGDLIAGTLVVDRRAAGGDEVEAAPIEVETDLEPAEAAGADGVAVGGASAVGASGRTAATSARPVDPADAEPPRAVADEPVWDARRGCYLMWHSGREQWLAFDDAQQRWAPLADDRPAGGSGATRR